MLKESEGELIIIAGRPSMGKSALMFQLALQVSKQYPVYVESLEMSRESIVRRMIAAEIGKSITLIQKGLISRAIVDTAIKKLSMFQFYVSDSTNPNIYSVCDAIRQTHKRYGTKLAVIDYMQLLRVEAGHSTNAEVSKISGLLKELARELKIPIVVGSQLSRDCDKRGASNGNYKPRLSDLRDSGAIEQDADIVAFVHREREKPGLASIIVGKNRNGAIGDIEMQFSASQTRFIDQGVSGGLDI